MDPAAAAGLTSPQDLESPLYLDNVIHNTRLLQHVKSTTSSVAGAAAGVLGLTNLGGFGFYAVVSLIVVPAAIAIAKGDMGRMNKYVRSEREVWFGGVVDNLFSYVLWWTLFYGLVHIYD